MKKILRSVRWSRLFHGDRAVRYSRRRIHGSRCGRLMRAPGGGVSDSTGGLALEAEAVPQDDDAMEIRFSYPLLRVTARALPNLRDAPRLKREGQLWRYAMLFVGPYAACTSGEIMTVAYDQGRENERTLIYFPRAERRAFGRMGRIAETAVWSDGVWTVGDRTEALGARRLNDFLERECAGGMGVWAGWDWLDLLARVVTQRDHGWPAALKESTLSRIATAGRDFPGQPVGFHPKGAQILVTYPNPNVVSVVSPWRKRPGLPKWAGGER